MQTVFLTRFSRVTIGVALSALALAACSKQGSSSDQSATTTTTENTMTTTNETAAATPAATPAAAAAPAADNTDTLSGVKLASYTGDATKGEAVFIACKTCHVIDPGVNRIGPSLHGVVGRKAGSIANFHYSAANKNSGITWTQEKLFQYLEKPQRVVPGTLMSYPGVPDPQKRADVIAYLKANS